MEQNYKYYAFISYKREDEKWAKWLHRKLERYRLPSAVCKEIPRLPKRVKPIFRDKTDLGAGELTANIHSEMERSRYLIVICSPKSAQSEWVGKEISYFKELGRYGHIIPFIVDGEPNSDNPLIECFNPALKEEHKELLGINISEIGKEQAFIKVVAKLLNIRFDALWGRERRRQRRNTIYKAIVACLVILLGLFTWEYKRPYYEYYADYVDKWGVPEGVVELNREQCSRRNGMYRFEYRRIPFGSDGFWGWRLSQVDFVNSVGTIKEHTNTEYRDRFAIQKLIFDKENKGILLQTNYCNRSGRVILRYKYSQYNEEPATVVDFIQSQEQMGAGFISAATTSISMGIMDVGNTRAKITRYIYDRDDNGYITKKSYRANNDLNPDISKICDADGVAGVVYELDSLGRISTISYIDMDDSISRTKIGVQSKKYKYDKFGNICETSYLDKNGKLAFNDYKWAKMVAISDDYGNIINREYRGVNGELCFNTNGNAVENYKYNSNGYMINISSWGGDGNPCLNKRGYHEEQIEYDNNGYWSKISYFNINGELCLTNEGVASCIVKYDSRGNIVEGSYFNINGELCLNKYGYAYVENKYDSQGNMINGSYWGDNGRPCLSNENISSWEVKYNLQGKITDLFFRGVNGEPCLNNEGYARLHKEYNSRGNIKQVSYFGVDHKPCFHKEGYAICKCKYDDTGNIINLSYYDTSGELCLNVYGYASFDREYDKRGNNIKTSYFGVNGERCLSNKNIAGFDAEYDMLGNCIKTSYFDIDGDLCLSKEGDAIWMAVYDSIGNIIQSSYYGTNETPCLLKDGYAGWHRDYDLRGNVTKTLYYGIDNKLCLHKDGNAGWQAKYDQRGNCIERFNLGMSGELLMNNSGYARIVNKYDDNGIFIKQIKYDQNNNMIDEQTTAFLIGVPIVNDVAFNHGIKKPIFILEFCSWNCKKDIMDVAYDIKEFVNKSKKIVYIDSNNNIISLILPIGRIGMQFTDQMILQTEKQDIIDRYDNWKKSNNN